MATAPAEAAVAVFAKAPVPGFAKTRLAPRLGAEGAAALQGRLTARAVATALAAGIGPVALWCAPDASHPAFRRIAAGADVALVDQAGADLGARMLRAFQGTVGRDLVLIGTDCPCLTPDDLRAAVAALREGADVVIAPAEDGGYGLIAASQPWPPLFRDMPWSTPDVAALTRRRASVAGLRLVEIRPVWDVDTPSDYDRLVREGLLA